MRKTQMPLINFCQTVLIVITGILKKPIVLVSLYQNCKYEGQMHSQRISKFQIILLRFERWHGFNWPFIPQYHNTVGAA